ncbi:MAG: hypothetical protein ACLSGI_09505 [Butyricicoccaceae bacterium]
MEERQDLGYRYPADHGSGLYHLLSLGFGKSEKTTYQNYLENQTTASVSDSVQ